MMSASRGASPTQRVLSILPMMMGFGGAVFWLIAVHQANYAAMNPFGLVSVMTWTFYAAIVMAVTGFFLELMGTNPRTGRLVALIVLMIMIMFGTAPAVEPVASLYDSWLHAGFIQYVIDHGRPLSHFDARFSWPGAFSLGAVVSAFVGRSNALGFLRWFPPFIELMYLAPAIVIARSSGVDRRAGWLGVALFFSCNWIYQDYFSPQALNYLFYLVIVAAVLATWRPRPLELDGTARPTLRHRLALTRRSLSTQRLGGHDAESTWSSSLTLAILALLCLILLASAMSHQLTPYATILALVAMLLGRRLGRPELVIVAGLFAVGWLSLGASDFWLGHLNAIFGSIGRFGGTITANVTGRITGNADHRLIVNARILEVVVLYLLAVIGAVRRRAESRSLEMLAASAFLLLALQDYGGEGLLRVVLFGLPFVTLLAASAFLPNRSGATRPVGRSGTSVRSWSVHHLGRRVSRALAAMVLLLFFTVTFAVRGGNDAFESFTTGELAASEFVYGHAKVGETIWMATPFMPTNFRNIDSMPVKIAAYQTAKSASTVDFDLFTLLSAHAHWIVLSASQAAWGVQVGGYAKDWMAPFQATLLASGYRVVARWSTATVLHLGPMK